MANTAILTENIETAEGKLTLEISIPGGLAEKFYHELKKHALGMSDKTLLPITAEFTEDNIVRANCALKDAYWVHMAIGLFLNQYRIPLEMPKI